MTSRIVEKLSTFGQFLADRREDCCARTDLTWTRLEVLEAAGDEVEFIAYYESPAGPGSLHERSVFERRGGRWVYVGAAD